MTGGGAIQTEGRTDSISETSAGGEGSSVPAKLPKDTIFDLLKVERRREVLKYLDTNGEETTLSDVAEHIAAKENGIEQGRLSSKQRKRVYVGLYQCHLPKMDDVDVIDFDQARGTIKLRSEAEQLFPYLYLDPEESDGGSQWQGLKRTLTDLL